MDFGKVFIVGGMSFYIMECKGPKIDPVPHFEENFSNDFISVFCFLFFM
jgi:hypothetical protein